MLYALPDHQVMDELLPAARRKYLAPDHACSKLQAQPGLVPVAIDPSGQGLLYFADIGKHPLQEWKFVYTIEKLAREQQIKSTFVTDLSLLDHPDLPDDGIEPFALLFHVSRCGSTLLTKTIARQAHNLTINQGGPLQEGFWSSITSGFQHLPEISNSNIHRLRRLVLLLTRARGLRCQRAFVKFISWNIIYFDLIKAAFPEASALYLYRDPAEVIANVMQETTAVLRARGKQQSHWLTGLAPEQTAVMDELSYLASCYAHYFRIAADKSPQTGLRLLNYRDLKQPGQLADICKRGLGLRLRRDEIRLMSEQYRYCSKDDSNKTVFIDDTPAKLRQLGADNRARIDAICASSTALLEENAGNLYPRGDLAQYTSQANWRT